MVTILRRKVTNNVNHGYLCWFIVFNQRGAQMTKKKEIINAFHPDYVKTYHPEFLEYFRLLTLQKRNGEAMTRFVNKKRKTAPNRGTIFGISDKV